MTRSGGTSVVDATRRARVANVTRYTKTRITVVSGPDAGKTLDFAAHSVRIGTAVDNDLVLVDDSVSRYHCEIVPSDKGLRVHDVGSTNGIVANGIALIDAVLRGSITLRLGETELIIRPLTDVVPRERAAEERFGEVLGVSAKMRELFADLARVAPTDLPLLIEGETGTGKDLVAESIHRASPRAAHPFVVFDCGAVAPTLAESELFGHERGAFTGAVGARPGVFEEANKGTVFLDELGELPKDLQPKLLRVLEKRELRRLGGSKVISIDVRLIAASNRNMLAEVQRGNFREDLYFRVAGAHVVVPPLRNRMDDLPILVQHFMSSQRPPRAIEEVSPEVWEMFRSYRWPGNVRELRNAVQRMLVMPERAIRSVSPTPAPESGKSVVAERAELADEAVAPLRVARKEANNVFEREYLRAVFKKAEGSITRAAAIAEVSRQIISKLVRKHGLH